MRLTLVIMTSCLVASNICCGHVFVGTSVAIILPPLLMHSMGLTKLP
jgi:hypothetical protein